MDVQELIGRYYESGSELYRIFMSHGRSVADKALQIAKGRPELWAEREFIEEAAMLHDIGIFLTDAPSIHCHGRHAYIEHGYLGGLLLRQEGLPEHARVSERHTGTGLRVEDIVREQLPLPLQDFSPESEVEQLICFSDKFFSKTKLDRELSVDYVRGKMQRFGESQLQRFDAWLEKYG